MPWSTDKTLPSLKKKSDEIRALFAEVANKVLRETQDEGKAIEAGLSAVSKKQGKVRVKKATTDVVNDVPLHLQVIHALKAKREAEQLEISKESELLDSEHVDSSTDVIDTKLLFKQKGQIEADPERSLVGIEWDRQDRLVLKFDDGAKLVSEPVPVSNSVRSSVIVSSNGGAVAVPTDASDNFVIQMNTQVCFAEEISMPDYAWIELNFGSILTEVN